MIDRQTKDRKFSPLSAAAVRSKYRDMYLLSQRGNMINPPLKTGSSSDWWKTRQMPDGKRQRTPSAIMLQNGPKAAEHIEQFSARDWYTLTENHCAPRGLKCFHQQGIAWTPEALTAPCADWPILPIPQVQTSHAGGSKRALWTWQSLPGLLQENLNSGTAIAWSGWFAL